MCFFFNPGPVRRVLIPNRYTAKAKLCFCKNNKRRIIGYQFSKVLDIGILSSKLARTLTFETFCQGFEMGKGKSAPGASAKGKERADHSILNHCTRGCVVCASPPSSWCGRRARILFCQSQEQSLNFRNQSLILRH